MAARGVHFALTAEEIDQLLALTTDSERLVHVRDQIEESFFDERPDDLVETDKTWDAIHRCLTDGTLRVDSAQPLGVVILGGKSLYSGDDYIMTLKDPGQVRAAAPLLAAVTERRFRATYEQIDQASYGGQLSDDDFEGTWDGFVELREFWERAAELGRNVLFTVDQ